MKIDHMSISSVGIDFSLSLVDFLRSKGLSVLNPITQEIVVFNKDADKQSLQSVSMIPRDNHEPAGIQIWLNETDDIYISWKEGNGGVSIFLDGLETDTVIKMMTICCEYVCNYAVKNSMFLDVSFDNQSA